MSEKDQDKKGISTAGALKNLVGVCVVFILTFGPYLGILSLQSSINNENGLGLTSAAVISACTGLSLPLIPVIFAGFGSKYSAITGHLLFIVYACCNIYPSWYTLMPGSVAMGVGLNLMFVSSLTHTSETASLYASSLGKRLEPITALFIAIFAASVKGGHVLGSLVSSSVLFNLDYNETSDFNTSNSEYYSNFSNITGQSCNNKAADYVEKDYLYYILIGIYIGLSLIGITLTLLMWNNFRNDGSNFRSLSTCFNAHVTNVIVGVFKLCSTYKLILLFPLFTTNGISIGFTTGTFSKVFVSDCVGIEWIGFVISTYGIVSLVAALVFGILRRVSSSFPMIWLGVAISSGMTLFLQFWSREPNYYAIFGYAVGWGISDAVWQAVVPGIISMVFSDAKSTAFTVYQVGVALGFVITFISGIFLSISTHLWIIFSIVLYAGISYTTLVIIMKINDMLSKREEKVKSDESKLLIKDKLSNKYDGASFSASSYSHSSIKDLETET